jgi:hypothetical protein
MPDTIDPSRRYLCRHVHTNGNRCGSPALRAQNFCYYHDRQRLSNAPLAGRIGIFKMQPIDDRDAIQIALYDVLSRITAGDIDNKRASILLYGLQIASSNLARRDKLQPPTTLVEDITHHHALGDLAPIEEIVDEQETATTLQERHAAIIQERHPEPQAKDPCISTATAAESTPTPQPPVILSEIEEPALSLSKEPATAEIPITLAAEQSPATPHRPAATATSTIHPHQHDVNRIEQLHLQTIPTAHRRHPTQAVAPPLLQRALAGGELQVSTRMPPA